MSNRYQAVEFDIGFSAKITSNGKFMLNNEWKKSRITSYL